VFGAPVLKDHLSLRAIEVVSDWVVNWLYRDYGFG